ncbi:hypothetical protein KQI84_04910 [bacterium]|nr:hypothetical protein [bacterium]
MTWVALIVCNIPIYCLLGWIMFKDWAEFAEGTVGAIYRSFELWEFWSVGTGEAEFNLAAVLKSAFWILISAAIVFGEYVFFGEQFGAWVQSLI